MTMKKKNGPIWTLSLVLFIVVAGCKKDLRPKGVSDNTLPRTLTSCNAELKTKILIPAYFYSGSPWWDSLTAQAALFPSKIYAIINTAFNGPGTAVDSTLLAKITAFRNAGGKVIGYVNSYNYGVSNRPIDSVKLDVDHWYAWYGSKMDGIFFDQMYPVDGGLEQFYRDLYVYVKGKDSNDIVMGNPGGYVVPTYVTWNGNRVTDVICTYENSASTIATWPWQFFTWQAGFTPDRFAFLIHTASLSDMYYGINEAVSRGYEWVYCTDDVMDNPYDQLPSYMTQLRKLVAFLRNGSYNYIDVDGSLNDWNNVPPAAIATSGNVRTFKMANDDSELFFMAQGSGLNVISNIYLNVDNDTSTGYSATAWEGPNGCDYMVENNILYKHTSPGWNWEVWDTLDNTQYYKSDSVIEIAVALSELNITDCSYIHAGFITNSSGDQLPKAGARMIFRALDH